MMIGVSKWKYSQSAIDERQDACDYYGDPSDRCKNEAWFIRELSQQLQEKFEIERNLTFAFMDSFSQSGPNLNDEFQQSSGVKPPPGMRHLISKPLMVSSRKMPCAKRRTTD